MNTIFLLLVTITSGFLKGARPEEGEGREGSGQSAQAARDAAALAREAQEQAARDAMVRKPERGRWGRPKLPQKQSDSQGESQDGGQQGKRPGSAGSKSGGDDGDTQATELAQKARGVVEDPFNLNETGAPTPATGRRDEGVTPEDIATRILEGGVTALKETAQKFMDSGSPTQKRMDDQANKLRLAADRFERTGKSSSSLNRVAKDVNRATELLANKSIDEIKVSQLRSGELKISSDGEAVRTKEITILFMPKGIIGKIKFCWNRYKLKSALKSYSDNAKIVKLAEAVFARFPKNPDEKFFPSQPEALGVNREKTLARIQQQREKAENGKSRQRS